VSAQKLGWTPARLFGIGRSSHFLSAITLPRPPGGGTANLGQPGVTMRKRGIWKELVVLLMGLAASSFVLGAGDADPPPAKKTTSGSWFPFWSGSTDKADKKASAKPEKEVQPDLTATPARPRREEAAEERAREQAILLRRLAVCDQLRLIAMQKKDDHLLQQADQLDERTWQVYLQRIDHLPVGKAIGDDRAPEPPAGARSLSIRK
jgi:hypothetical protein